MTAKPTMMDGADDAVIASWLHSFLFDRLAQTREPVAISLPGGSTPFPVLEQLIAHDRDLPADERLDFARLNIWPGDDRIVEESHPASNTGKLRELFEPVGAHVVTLSIMEKVPHFALVWLGMGADGHIASLFPNTDPQADDPQKVRQLTPDPLPREAPFDRVTLTIPALLDSEQIVFVIRGEDKRNVFEEAARGANDLPVARLLAAARQPVTCFA
ncbi:6-phosphogluconolactonase [Parapontixanthobacter aurantiacus]|nr:6-phosphogluconolactonase [Parapontixanthobacter aurantiacus]